jgi:septum formation protein
MSLILASQSERRYRLLKELGCSFETIPSGAEEAGDEVFYSDAPLVSAEIKAREVARQFPAALVIGVDTVIEFERKVIGKPADIVDASRILASLAGKTHYVVSGVCILRLSDDTRCIFSETTEVKFKPLSYTAIKQYLENVHVLDKAGAYAIQEYGEMIIDSIDGPLDNVIGLPCTKLAMALKACGLNLP